MSLTFCDLIQHAFVILQFLADVSKCKSLDSPFISTMRCENSIGSELHLEFNEMIKIMKKSIDPQISKEIQLLTKQPKYNSANFFKHEVQFVARFVLDRIEKAFDQINYDHFFSNKIENCPICQNQTTSRICLKDKDFKSNFIKTSIELFNQHPLEIEKRKFEIIDEFNKKDDLNILTHLYDSFRGVFDDTKSERIELEMQNLIKDRFLDCCSKKSRTQLNTKSSKF